MSDASNPGFIPPHGNYRELVSYRKAEVVYDLTYRFCHRFLARTDRTIDQMIQAARSGKQNIVESSKASGTSKEMEIKLIGVAGQAWKNCWLTIATYSEFGTFHSGKKIAARPDLFGALAAILM